MFKIYALAASIVAIALAGCVTNAPKDLGQACNDLIRARVPVNFVGSGCVPAEPIAHLSVADEDRECAAIAARPI